MFTLYGIAVAPALKPYKIGLLFTHITGTPNDNFWKISVRKYDLRSRIFGTFVVKFLACMPLLGFSNLPNMVQLSIFNGFVPLGAPDIKEW